MPLPPPGAVQIPVEWRDGPGHPRYKELLTYAYQLHVAKGGDYSGESRDSLSNLRTSSDLGVRPFVGVLVRISDKWERIKSLIRDGRTDKPRVADEAIVDTLMDLSAYALLDIILLEEESDAEPGTDQGRSLAGGAPGRNGSKAIADRALEEAGTDPSPWHPSELTPVQAREISSTGR